MRTDLSKDQMIYESYLAFHALEKRIDRHSIEHKEMFNKIFHELQEIRKDFHQQENAQRALIEQQSASILKIETEKNIAIKVLVPIISIIVTVLTNLFSRKI
jgi:hypothetical protein